MATDASAVLRPAVLSDLIPGRLVRDVALVVAAAGLTGVAAQVSIPLPGTPVPLTLQTFAVLLAGAALGLPRALLGMSLYLLIGQLGVPWFAPSGGNATLGYVVGFILAASVVGALAGRGGDRTPARTVVTMTLGTLLIYAVGVPWLMVATGMDLPSALAAGVVPFLIGDAIKVAAAAGLLPAAWKLARR
ncbi:biotin biosynthesis protein BioY [Sphaerisporangium melleum]|uniref:Biotin transporter n=1 Tax=Sphaerisporangium melleum TaxID=321316 RepID=A0A917RHJ6_9ACTN|nr:biotin transporter BioY [Sphaerisporangium melleum]GGL08579.1 biotin biosynthesis protein BioY [Sphaerisporangium melleum]GII68810.1 biotin biosynthesis protein BioY [Sphaerisporangium melleum]